MTDTVLNQQISLIKDLSNRIRLSGLSLLTVAVYIAITLQSIDAYDYLGNTTIKLPVISTDVSLVLFYIWSPVLLLFIQIQIFIRFYNLKRLCADTSNSIFRLHKYTVERRKFIDSIDPWPAVPYFMAIENPALAVGYFHKLSSFITTVSMVFIPSALIGCINISCLPLHDNFVTNFVRVIFALSLFITISSALILVKFTSHAKLLIASLGSAFISIAISTISMILLSFPGESIVTKSLLEKVFLYDYIPIKEARLALYNKSDSQIQNPFMGQGLISNIIVIRANSVVNKQKSKNDFSEYNFFNRNLIGMQVSELNLSGANFTQTNLTDTSFDNVNLTNSKFSRSIINRSFIRQSKIVNADFVESIIIRTSFVFSNINGGNFAGANVIDGRFHGSNIVSSDFTRSRLYQVTFTNLGFVATRLNNALLYNIVFQGVNFHENQINNSVIFQSTFNASALRFVDLRLSTLITNSFFDVTFQEIDLRDFTNFNNEAERTDVTNSYVRPQSAKRTNGLQFALTNLNRIANACKIYNCQSNELDFDRDNRQLRKIIQSACQSERCLRFVDITSNKSDVDPQIATKNIVSVLCSSVYGKELIKFLDSASYLEPYVAQPGRSYQSFGENFEIREVEMTSIRSDYDSCSKKKSD